MACGTRAFCLDLHYNPGVKLHHELRGSPSTWNGIHLVYEFLFPIFFFFFALIIIAGTSSIAGKTDKIIFLIPLFDCFITWVTQSKGSRGPMHSRHYAGNLFSLAWPPIPIMHVWCLAFLSIVFLVRSGLRWLFSFFTTVVIEFFFTTTIY